MRVDRYVTLERINGRWVLVIESRQDDFGDPIDLYVSAVDVVESVRMYAPELLKEE